MESVTKKDQREVQWADGADFGTSELIRYLTIINGFPFPYPVDYILSELSTMTHPSWVALHDMAHSFTELDKAWSIDQIG